MKRRLVSEGAKDISDTIQCVQLWALSVYVLQGHESTCAETPYVFHHKDPKGIGEKTHERLMKALGDKAHFIRTDFNLCNEFKFGRTNLEYEPRSGRPPTAVTKEKIELVRFLLKEDRRITYQQLVKSVGIGSASINTIINDNLKYRKHLVDGMVETRSGKMQDPEQERIKVEESAKPQPGATIGGDASSDPVVLNPNIDIPKYDGTEDPRPWIESLEEIGFLYHWADYIISRYAAMNMIGSAKTWLNLHKISFTSWENFKSRLIEDFASDANKEEMKTRLNRMQQWNEPAIRFAEDILVLCNKVDPQMEEETKINWVIGGLKKEYSFALHLNPPKNTNELLEICKKLDLFEKNYQERVEKSKALYNGPRSPRPHYQEQWKNARSFRRPCQNTSKPQAPRSKVSAPRRPYTHNPEPEPVYPRKTYNKSPESNRNRTEDGRPTCFKCNKPGHVARYCRVRLVRIVEEDLIVTQDKVEEEIRMNNGTEKSRPLLYADVSAKERTIITDQIDEMLEEGIIRPSSGPWSFPVILVKKRDGKYRFCVDYRKLNEVTVKDVYPIPRIDDVMDTLQGSKYFSAINLKSGYWQVEIEDRDKEKTAFTTAHGLYEFNVMPFGLCTSLLLLRVTWTMFLEI
ncbi:K02A2.6-like [Cordylochernes scorpioides]|uniref:K02A2.6-like n=1 Tax=Cordylochernes scorpioides TaxID=51811 RepID=A0ABY6LSF2_9ARAC|nr:K02A2.6-like [Cordylochernes scorpioides]